MRTLETMVVALIGGCGGPDLPSVPPVPPGAEVLVSRVEGVRVSGFALAPGGKLYWTNWTSAYGELSEGDLMGGQQTLLLQEIGHYQDPVVHGDTVYWNHWETSTVWALVPATMQRTAYIPHVGSTSNMVADEDSLYVGADGWVLRVPWDGTGTVPLTDPLNLRQPTVATPCGNDVCWAVQLPEGYVYRAPRDGGEAEQLAYNQYYPGQLVADDTYLYWVNNADEPKSEGAVMRFPLAGGAPEVFVGGLKDPMAIAADATQLYVSQAGRVTLGSILKIEKGTGKITALAAGLDEPTQIHLDDTYVYFSCFGSYFGGSIMRIRKDFR